VVAKSIDLGGGLKFLSITEAKAYFGAILKETPLKQHVSAQEFSELKVLYEKYCRKTNWPIPSAPTAFFADYERRDGYSTKCFWVIFQNGDRDRFSLDKALSAVAIQNSK
jgi:hypothetical protein